MRLLLILLMLSTNVLAYSPCDNLDYTTKYINNLQVSDDPNFQRIKEQNNQQLILECQQYMINQVHQLNMYRYY